MDFGGGRGHLRPNSFITGRKRSLGQGNFFYTCVSFCSQEGEGAAQSPPCRQIGVGVSADSPGCRPPLDADPQMKTPLGWENHPWMQTPGVDQTPPRCIPPGVGQIPPTDADPLGLAYPPSPIRPTSGRYASYWNAYLFSCSF